MTKTQRRKIEDVMGAGTQLEQYKNLHKASISGKISDDVNPMFMFSMISTDVLALIAQGKIDPVWFAKKELANRGQCVKGQWVGFDKAAVENFK